MAIIPIETKAQILEDAKQRIPQGHTLIQIAESHGITKQTLNSWLMSLGDEYAALRQSVIDAKLSEVESEMDSASEPFALARARERWKAATWYAERRDRARYGVQVQNINIINGVTMDAALVSQANELLDHIKDE